MYPYNLSFYDIEKLNEHFTSTFNDTESELKIFFLPAARGQMLPVLAVEEGYSLQSTWSTNYTTVNSNFKQFDRTSYPNRQLFFKHEQYLALSPARANCSSG